MVQAPYDEKSDIWSFKRPGIAVDVVLLSVFENSLQVGLIERQEEPYHGSFALPGRFVRYEEKLTQTAHKALEKKAGITSDQVYLRQLKTFGDELVRDTRIRTISVVYYALIPRTIVESSNTISWHSFSELPIMAFDHKDIVEQSVKAIRERLFYTDAIFYLLTKEFTLSELQQTYEAVLGEELDKRNFRKKIFEVYDLKDLKRLKRSGAHRPAKLYSFVKKKKRH